MKKIYLIFTLFIGLLLPNILYACYPARFPLFVCDGLYIGALDTYHSKTESKAFSLLANGFYNYDGTPNNSTAACKLNSEAFNGMWANTGVRVDPSNMSNVIINVDQIDSNNKDFTGGGFILTCEPNEPTTYNINAADTNYASNIIGPPITVAKGDNVAIRLMPVTGITMADSNAATCPGTLYQCYTHPGCYCTSGEGLQIYVGGSIQNPNSITSLGITDSNALNMGIVTTPGLINYNYFIYQNNNYSTTPNATTANLGSFNPNDKVFGAIAATPQYFIYQASTTGLLNFKIAGAKTTATGSYQVQVTHYKASCTVQGANPHNKNDGVVGVYVGNDNPNSNYSVVNNPCSDSYIYSSASSTSVLDKRPFTQEKLPLLTVTGQNSYNGPPPAQGSIWLKVIDQTPVTYSNIEREGFIKKYITKYTTKTYTDNHGSYNVNIYTVTSPSLDGSIVGSVFQSGVDAVKSMIDQAWITMFINFAGNATFQTIARAMLGLYITIYGIYFLLGFVQMTQHDILMRFMKMGLIVTLISPQSFTFFYLYFGDLFISGSTYIIRSFGNTSTTLNIGHNSNMFGFIDLTLSQYFDSGKVWLKIIAMLFTPPVGPILFIYFIWFMFHYLGILLKAVLSYLFAYIGLGLLFALAPLFIIAILFERTKNYFTTWINYLVAYTIMPIIMFSGIIWINQIVMDILFISLSYPVEWGCAVTFKMPMFNVFLIADEISNGISKLGLDFGTVSDQIGGDIYVCNGPFCLLKLPICLGGMIVDTTGGINTMPFLTTVTFMIVQTIYAIILHILVRVLDSMIKLSETISSRIAGIPAQGSIDAIKNAAAGAKNLAALAVGKKK